MEVVERTPEEPADIQVEEEVLVEVVVEELVDIRVGRLVGTLVEEEEVVAEERIAEEPAGTRAVAGEVVVEEVDTEVAEGLGKELVEEEVGTEVEEAGKARVAEVEEAGTEVVGIEVVGEEEVVGEVGKELVEVPDYIVAGSPVVADTLLRRKPEPERRAKRTGSAAGRIGAEATAG